MKQPSRYWVVIAKQAWASNKLMYCGVFFLSIVSTLGSVKGPESLKKLIDLPFDADPEFLKLEAMKLLSKFAFFVMISSLARFIANRILFSIAVKSEDHWRSFALNSIYSQVPEWLLKQSPGSLASKIDLGSKAVWNLLFVSFGQDFIFAIPNLIGVLIVAVYKAPQAWTVFVLPIVCYYITVEFISWLSSSVQKETFQLRDNAAKKLYNGLANVMVVKSFGNELYELNTYSKLWKTFHNRESTLESFTFLRLLLQSLMDIIMRAFLLTVCLFNNDLRSAGTVTMLVTYQGMIIGPLRKINHSIAVLKQQNRQLSGMIDVAIRQKKRIFGTRNVASLQQGLNFVDVSFSYPGKTILQNLSFKVLANQTTAIVGRSGAGKSTILALIQRFLEPSSGQIFWDDFTLQSLQKESLYSLISTVPQDCALFDGSIRFNVCYGNPDASEREMKLACEKANILDLIEELPQGFDTIIGADGIKLSGGQQQRLAIARAVLTSPKLLLFDESTSNLDSECELAIKGSLQRMSGKVTVLIVTHRLSTIMDADQIIVINNQTIEAIGKHKFLLKNSPTYKQLFQISG